MNAEARSLPSLVAGFRDGDRWTAVGDSLTHTGSFHTWIQLYHLTRFPSRTFELTNCGIAGDTAAGALRRLSWDILPTRPTVATVMLGINDAGLALYAPGATDADLPERRQAALTTYRQNLTALVTALQAAGSRVILLTPTIFDQTAELPAPKRPGLERALASAAEFVRQLAVEKRVDALVDLHQPMLRLNAELQRTDPAATLIGPDRIHPGAPGHLVMAWLFLLVQQAPGEVSHLALDAATAHVLACRGGGVSEIERRDDGGLAWTWSAAALPFPISPAFAPALRWVPFMDDLNHEIFRVTSLSSGPYALSIDDAEIGVFSAEELARGVNLAEHANTPQQRQAQEVLRLVEARRHHVAETLRNMALVEHQSAPADGQPYTLASAQPHYDRRLAQIPPADPANANLLRIYHLYPQLKPRETEHRQEADRLAAEARRVAQPRPHRFVLKPR